MFKTCKKPPMSIISASGSICTFNALQEGLPLKSHVVQLTATQSGSGTPSPINPRAINGYSAINIGSDAKYAGFINFNQLCNFSSGTSTVNSVEISRDGNGKVTLNGTCDLVSGSTNALVFTFSSSFINGHKYLIGATGTRAQHLTVTPNGVNNYMGDFRFFDAAFNLVVAIYAGETYDNESIYPMIKDLTAMFGAGNEPSTVAEVQALFPNDYYAYNAGTLTTVSAVNGVSGSMNTIQIGSTVYGGEYDARTGVFKVTHGYADLGSLNWQRNAQYVNPVFLANIPEAKPAPSSGVVPDATCSQYKVDAPNRTNVEGVNYVFTVAYYYNSSYNINIIDKDYSDVASFKTAMSGVQLVYELATPTTIQLPPCPIDTLLGENNIWSDTGNTSLEAIKIGR